MSILLYFVLGILFFVIALLPFLLDPNENKGIIKILNGVDVYNSSIGFLLFVIIVVIFWPIFMALEIYSRVRNLLRRRKE